MKTSSVPLNPLQPLTRVQSTEKQRTQYEEPCEHHYEYVDKRAMAPSKTLTYDYAFLDGPLPNNKKRSEVNRIGEEDYVIKNNTEVTSNIPVTKPKSEANEVQAHGDYVIRDKSYVTVIASEPAEAKEVETHDDYVVRDKSYITVLS